MKRALMASAALLLVSPVTPAFAQDKTVKDVTAGDDAVTLGDVVVTARKVEERLRDVPVAATVLDAETLNNRAAPLEMGSIVNSSPGARFNDLGTTATSEISMRGSGTFRASNADSPIGLYANGVYVQGGLQFARNFTRIDQFDLGRAEVLRGTQGALFGRNSVYGAVNLVPQKPKFDNSGLLMLDYGAEIDKKDATAIVNFNLGETLAFRIGGEVIDQDQGFFRQAVGGYADERHGWLGRVQGRYAKGPVDVTLTYQAEDMRLPFQNMHYNIVPGTPAAATYGFTTTGYTTPDFFLPWNTAARSYEKVSQGTIDAKVQTSLGELSSLTSYRYRFRAGIFDTDYIDEATLAALRAQVPTAFTVLNGSTARYLGDRTWSYYQDIHLAGNPIGDFTWLIGADFLRQDTKYRVVQDQATGATNPITGAPLNQAFRRTNTVPFRGDQKLYVQSKAVYFTAGYRLTDKWNASFEGRYTDDYKRASSIDFIGPPRLNGTPGGGIFGLGVATQVQNPFTIKTFDNTNFSYNLTTNYKFAPNWMGYLKYGTAYRAGGFNSGRNPVGFTAPNPVLPTYGPETMETVEAGVKGNLAPSVYTTFTAYHNKGKDTLVQTSNGCTVALCGVGAAVFAVNAGETDTWGFEGEVTTRFALFGGRTLLSASGSRQRGEYRKSAYAGRTIPQTPTWVANANLNYTHPITEDVMGLLNVNYHEQWGGVQDVELPQKALEDFSQVDVRVAARAGHVELALYANNIFNTVYHLRDDSDAMYRLSSPRTYGVQIRYSW
ncbi:TonB-dependent receptor [Phenylobacterium sp.]|uniref:TonB-dependent receptor n=1 Tax=Phenylobacterium sp. TaxID=1871053 RepID=UPI0025FA5124|nr:TonB-dependent receptor [Phenylobacterium sp.]MBX3483766.1 TonB-dependent receptor [Phenylobacterium sp.]MCW5759109.1 TonB-dependent receptor [Phenylobacterium sp.]